MKIDLLDPVVAAAPGETAVCRVRVHNDTTGPSAYRLRVVGLNAQTVEYPLGFDPLPSGGEASFDVGLMVPASFAAGSHSLAVEVISDRRGERPVLAGMTVEVSSIQKVAMRINPSTIRGRTRGRFQVEIDNGESRMVELDLTGLDAKNLTVTFARSHVRLRPGDAVAIPATVKGKRHLTKGPINHTLTIAAESNSAPLYADAAFKQAPILPSRFRSGIAIIAFLSLWAAILGAGAYWIAHHNSSKKPAANAALIDTNGDGIADQPLGSLPTANTTGTGGATGGAAAGGAAAPGAGGGAGAGGAGATSTDVVATTTVISGTVKAGTTGDDSGVTVTLTPATLGGANKSPAEQAALDRGDAGPHRAAKIWPAFYNRAGSTTGVADNVTTVSIDSVQSSLKGAWSFANVLIHDNYEVKFSKPGFETKAFIVTPPEDGKAVELKVTLDTAKGSAGGVVVGPSGPLGGVDLVITDGVLTFSTKSSSEAGKVGQFSVTGLSTPNTYTLTATLRGYGTEVQQLQLNPGEQRTNLSIALVLGVGSISGHVSAEAAPLGGVTITASSGEVTRSTTSLTIGDSGSYLLPQLKIPGTYTLTASANGYVTQTLQLQLAGNVGEVDFSLIRTTGSMIGLVKSDTNGALAGVGITISHEQLKFTSTTAAAPSAGTFRIDDLPPGEYLVSFSRFDHGDVSQLVTIAAGQVKDLGTIMMKFRPTPPLAQTGQITVAIFDSASVPLTGATVQILRPSDNAVLFTATDTPASPQASFAFPNMPIGTYTVKVSRTSYRTVTQRVSVGLSEVKTTFSLLRLGQIRVHLVDATDPTHQLTNYEITIYRLKPDGTRDGAALDRHSVLNNQAPDADGNIYWETAPNSLTDGTYEVDVSETPPGYSVTDQQLDPRLPGTVGRFVISPTDQDTIDLNPIKADPYPQLSGKIFVPVLGDTSTVPNGVSFQPLDANATVTLNCTGAIGTATATLTDTAAPTGFDTYTFDRTLIGAAKLIGAGCVLTVVSPSFATATIPLPNPLAISTGGVKSDQVLNVALTLPAATTQVSGSVFWTDKGASPATQIPVGTVNVTTTGDVITGYTPATGGGNPTIVHSGATIVGTNVSGTWTVSGQVFGKATYVFTDPAGKFGTGQLSVTMNESGQAVAVLVSNLDSVSGSGSAGGINVGLNPASGASIQGLFTVDSVKTNPPFASLFTVNATPPGGVSSPHAVGSSGAYSIAPVAAGTWHLTFATSSPNYVFSGPQTATPFVNPGGTDITGVSTRLYELGSITIAVKATGGGLLPAGVVPTITLDRIARSGVPGDNGASSIVLNPATNPDVTFNAATGEYTVSHLLVNSASPLGQAQMYNVSVTVPGYDNEYTTVLTTTTTNSTTAGANAGFTETNGVSVKAQNMKVPLLAGEDAIVSVTVNSFGSVIGKAVGDVGGGATEDLPYGGANPLTVTATRTAGPLDPNDPLHVARLPFDASIPATVAASAGNSFTVTGPPGLYTLHVVHPQYNDDAANVIANVAIDDGSNPATTNLFTLGITAGSINVEAMDTVGATVGTAEVTYWKGTVKSGAGTTVVTPALGALSIAGLVPGSYVVETHHFTAITHIEDRYPSRVVVTVPRGSAGVAGSVTVNPILQTLGGSLHGTLQAINQNGRNVQLPTSVTVTRTYSADATKVNGTPTSNQITESEFNPAVNNVFTVTRPTGDDSVPQTYHFDDIPGGAHTLLFQSAAGYTAPTPNPLAVAVTGDTTRNVSYAAAYVNIVVHVTSNASRAEMIADPSTTLTLASPFPAASTSPLLTLHGNNGVAEPAGATPLTATGYDFTFTTVETEASTSPYTLTITAPFHSTYSNTSLVVHPSATALSVNAALTANGARITGKSFIADDASTTAKLPTTGLVELLDRNTVVDSMHPDVNGFYDFPSSGSTYTITSIPYSIRVSLTGYATRTSSSTITPLPGITNTPSSPVTVPKLATATITVPGSEGTAPSLSVTMTLFGSSTVISTVNADATADFSALDPSLQYTFHVTATDYIAQDISTPATQAPGAHFTSTASGTQFATVTITISGGSASLSSLRVVMTPEGGAAQAAVTPTYNSTSGKAIATYTGLSPTTRYAWEITATGYQPYEIVLQAVNSGANAISATPVVPATAVITITGNAALDSSLRVTMTPTGGTAGTPVTPTPGTGGSAGTSSATFPGLDLTKTYSWAVTANNFKTATIASGTLATGNNPYTTSLAQRTVTVTVTTDGANTSNAKAATVTLEIPTGTTSAGVLAHTASTNVYAFNGSEFGAGQATATATGYRTNSATFGATTAALGANANVSIDLLGLVNISGKITQGGTGENGVTVRLMSGATIVDSTTTAGNGSTNRGSFSFTGVDVGSYMLFAFEDGVGAYTTPGGTPIVVDATNTPVNDGIGSFALAARNVTYNFVVKDNNGVAVSGATVLLNGATANTDTSGLAQITTLKEDATIGQFTADGGTGFLRTVGNPTTYSTSTLSSTTNVTLYPAPPISGTVSATISGTTAPQGNATVLLCQTGAAFPASACKPGAGAIILQSVTTSATAGSIGDYTFDTTDLIAGNTYRVRAFITITATNYGSSQSTGNSAAISTTGVLSPAVPYNLTMVTPVP